MPSHNTDNHQYSIHILIRTSPVQSPPAPEMARELCCDKDGLWLLCNRSTFPYGRSVALDKNYKELMCILTVCLLPCAVNLLVSEFIISYIQCLFLGIFPSLLPSFLSLFGFPLFKIIIPECAIQFWRFWTSINNYANQSLQPDWVEFPIEITSWKVRTYGLYSQVVKYHKMSKWSFASEWVSWYETTA